MQSVLVHLLKIDANYYSFVSGVFIALSVNLYTNIFSGSELPDRWELLLLSSLITFISSIAWIWISWKLGPVQRLANSQPPDGVAPEQTYRALIAGKELSLFSPFVIAILMAITGLAILPLGY